MKIGFIGLGIMGESMSKRIVDLHDDDVFVFDISEEKVNLLVSQGAKACTSSLELAEKADIIISMVPTSKNTYQVFEDIKKALNKDKIWIDMSTISPIDSRKVAKKVKDLGAQFADAPVVKSKPAAISGELGVYVGCDQDLFEKIKPILSYMGNNIIRMGDNGNGLVMKICHNALVSQIQNGVNETIRLAQLNKIDIDEFVTAISYGGGQNFYLESKKDSIKESNYKTAFSIENMNKDVGICLDMAKNLNYKMSGIENIQKVYEEAMEKGFAKDDFSKTFEIIRER